MHSVKIDVQVLQHGRGLPLPAYHSGGAAGLDLRAAVPQNEPERIEVGGWKAVQTGMAMAIPVGWEGQIRSRSGLARDLGVVVLNSPGTIDSDFRGEIEVLLINHGKREALIERGMRIAQLVVCPVSRAALSTSEQFEATGRGIAGFGSTGMI